MPPDHSCTAADLVMLRGAQCYKRPSSDRIVMLVSLALAWLRSRRAFVWSPALDLSDGVVYSELFPGAPS